MSNEEMVLNICGLLSCQMAWLSDDWFSRFWLTATGLFMAFADSIFGFPT